MLSLAFVEDLYHDSKTYRFRFLALGRARDSRILIDNRVQR